MSMSDPAFWIGYDARRDANKRVGQWKEYAGELEQEVIKLMNALKIEKSHSAGLMAQAVALKDIVQKMGDPTGILEKVSETNAYGPKKGMPKSNLTKVYDTAFDAEATKQGITQPASHRP